MHFFTSDHSSNIDRAPRNRRVCGFSNQPQGISCRDVHNEVDEGAHYAQAARPRGWCATIATPTRGKAFARDQQVKVQELGTGRFFVAFVVRDTNADDQTVFVTINGQQSTVPNDPAFIG